MTKQEFIWEVIVLSLLLGFGLEYTNYLHSQKEYERSRYKLDEYMHNPNEEYHEVTYIQRPRSYFSIAGLVVTTGFALFFNIVPVLVSFVVKLFTKKYPQTLHLVLLVIIGLFFIFATLDRYINPVSLY